MIIEEVRTFLSNRKSYLSMLKASAVKSGDFLASEDLQNKIEEVEAIQETLGSI